MALDQDLTVYLLKLSIDIDGHYQSNRSKRMFKVLADGRPMPLTEIKLEFQQSEFFMPDGRTVASPWVLYPLTERADDALSANAESITAEKCSVIEVYVLRCGADDIAESASGFDMVPSREDLTSYRMRGNWTNESFSKWQKAVDSLDKETLPPHFAPGASLPYLGPSIQQGFLRNPPLSSWVIKSTRALAYAQYIQDSNPKQFDADVAEFSDYILVDMAGSAPHFGERQPLGDEKTTGHDAPCEKIQKVLRHVDNITSELPDKPSHAMIKGSTYGYMSNIVVPKYLDSIGKPYAKFIFHYRDRGLCSFFFELITNQYRCTCQMLWDQH